ncbi:MAG: gliding motility-associated C-terminal domain-containing protein [Bacteroidota bacterium]|nr:gliding motility-associated C-terminal domain-containing protein [Bacteroidota bacterium]
MTICYGSSTELFSSGGISYNWTPTEGLSDPHASNPIANPSDTTTYHVFITDSNNCTFEDSVVVNVVPELIADFAFEIDDGCESLPIVKFINKSIGVKDFIWDFGDGNTSLEENPVHQYQQEGSYNAKIITEHGQCSDFKEVVIPLKKVFIPNVFTPNNDLVNDYFEITSNLPITLTIFNRWGKQIFREPDYQNKWDAEGFPTGTYYYEVKFADGLICKGWLQVLR